MRMPSTGTPAVKIHGSVISEAKSFTIEDSELMFELLSSKLYTNPRRAILRELSCNAWDEHVRVGKEDVPFEVDLPDRFTKQLRIRDFGEGLSEEKATGLYTRFGASDKRESNDLVGALGLGSKSPLGYTNNFSVISYQNGERRTYYVYLEETDDRGAVPMMQPQGCEKTDEPDGLEIIIPTQDDAWEWEREVKHAFKWYPTKPKFNKDIDIPDIDELDRCGNITIHGSTKYGSADWYVVQGVVEYPLNLNELDNDYSRLENIEGVVHVDIGDVTFTPSRDAIRYSKHTIANIQKHLDTFIEEYEKELVAEVEQVTEYQDLREIYERVNSNSFASKSKPVIAALNTVVQDIVAGMFGIDIDLLRDKIDKYQKKLKRLKKAGDEEKMRITRMKFEENLSEIEYHLSAMQSSNGLSALPIPTEGRPYPLQIARWLLKLGRKEVEESPQARSTFQLTLNKAGNYGLVQPENHVSKFYLLVNNTDKRVTMAIRRYLAKECHSFIKDSVVLYIDDAENEAAVTGYFEDKDIMHEVHYVSDLDIELERPKGTGPRVQNVMIRCMEKQHRRRYWNSYYEARWNRGIDKNEVLNGEYIDEESRPKYAWCEVKKYDWQNTGLNEDIDIDSVLHTMHRDHGLEGIIAVKADYVDEFKDAGFIHIKDWVQDVILKEFKKIGGADAIVSHLLWDKLPEEARCLVRDLNGSAKNITNPEVRKLFAHKPNRLHGASHLLHSAERYNVELDFDDPEELAEEIASGLNSLYNQVTGLKVIAKHVDSMNKADRLEVVKLINEYTQEGDDE